MHYDRFFWRSIEEYLLIGTDFKDAEDLKKEFVEYLYYYNNERPYQGIAGKKPVEMIERKNDGDVPEPLK